MKNIFENAYFGKPYKTRDGRKAIYLGNSHKKYGEDEIITILDGNLSFHIVELNGLCKSLCTCPSDIVSEWQEEINEEELDELAWKSLDKEVGGKISTFIKGFKVGYRKAWRGKYGSKKVENDN